jgi:hypothetical protein
VSSNSALSNPRIFYGWFVVAAAFAVTFVGFGSAYTFSAFVEPLQRDFAASRGRRPGRSDGALTCSRDNVCRHGARIARLGILDGFLAARRLCACLRRVLRRLGRVFPAVVMDYFGGRNVSGIIGILYTSVAFGTLIGPSAAGFAFDLTRSYTLPILASSART